MLHLDAHVTIKLQKKKKKWNTYFSVDGSLRAHGEDRGHGASVIIQRMFNKTAKPSLQYTSFQVCFLHFDFFLNNTHVCKQVIWYKCVN
jgi:hypothetical protein